MSSHSCSSVKPVNLRYSGEGSEHQHNLKRRQTLAFSIFQVRKMTFSKFWRMQIILSTQSHLILFFAVSLSIDIIASLISRSSVIVDLWNVLIKLNFLKFCSKVLRTAMICKLLLWLPHSPFQSWLKTRAKFLGPISNLCCIHIRQWSSTWAKTPRGGDLVIYEI